MVDLSNDAAELVRSLVSHSGLPRSAGVRLGTDDDSHALAMNLQEVPREDDVALEQQGATVWVSPEAAARLQGQTLHAQLEPRAAFFVD